MYNVVRHPQRPVRQKALFRDVVFGVFCLILHQTILKPKIHAYETKVFSFQKSTAIIVLLHGDGGECECTRHDLYAADVRGNI